MMPFQPLLLSYALNAVWKVPLIALAAAVVASLAAHVFGSNPALARHRVWVAALVFEVVLPAIRLPGLTLRGLLRSVFALLSMHSGLRGGGLIQVVLGPAARSQSHMPPAALTLTAAAYVLSVAYFLLRFLHGLLQARRIVAAAKDFPAWPALPALAGVRTATSDLLSGPATLGVRRPVVLLPGDFFAKVSEEDRLALLWHELEHIRRRDFALNLLYALLALPIAFHPALWWTRQRLAESREMVCDAAAANAVGGTERYAHSLLRLAETLLPPTSAPYLNPIGLFDAYTFERRIMYLSVKPIVVSRTRRALMAMAAVVLVALFTTSALALHLEAPAPAGQQQVSGGIMAGQLVYKVPPVYPAEAKAHHDTLDGPVMLRVIIGKDGVVQNIMVQQSLRRDYDMSALEAVRQWRYEPYLLNGEPIEVETTVTVTYSIDRSRDTAQQPK